MPSRKLSMHSRKIFCVYFSCAKAWESWQNLQNLFRSRKLAKLNCTEYSARTPTRKPRECCERNLQKKSSLEQILARFWITLRSVSWLSAFAEICGGGEAWKPETFPQCYHSYQARDCHWLRHLTRPYLETIFIHLWYIFVCWAAQVWSCCSGCPPRWRAHLLLCSHDIIELVFNPLAACCPVNAESCRILYVGLKCFSDLFPAKAMDHPGPFQIDQRRGCNSASPDRGHKWH